MATGSATMHSNHRSYQKQGNTNAPKNPYSNEIPTMLQKEEWGRTGIQRFIARKFTDLALYYCNPFQDLHEGHYITAGGIVTVYSASYFEGYTKSSFTCLGITAIIYGASKTAKIIQVSAYNKALKAHGKQIREQQIEHTKQLEAQNAQHKKQLSDQERQHLDLLKKQESLLQTQDKQYYELEALLQKYKKEFDGLSEEDKQARINDREAIKDEIGKLKEQESRFQEQNLKLEKSNKTLFQQNEILQESNRTLTRLNEKLESNIGKLSDTSKQLAKNVSRLEGVKPTNLNNTPNLSKGE